MVDAIQQKIAPFVGDTLARASTRSHCAALGIVGDEMSAEQLRTLLDRISKGMRVFVGPGPTRRLLAELLVGFGLDAEPGR